MNSAQAKAVRDFVDTDASSVVIEAMKVVAFEEFCNAKTVDDAITVRNQMNAISTFGRALTRAMNAQRAKTG